jgi:hypothetical protein
MRTNGWPLIVACLFLWSPSVLSAQDLAPRAYVITPTHSNAIILAYSQFSGNLEFTGAVPITGATANANLLIFSYYHTLNFFGKTASVTIAMPYGIGDFRGTVLDAPKYAYRSGLLDSSFRFSVNLKGGPAMKWSD